MENFGRFCFLILVIAALAVCSGFVFMTLYDWFIVSTFSANPLSLPQSMGIVLILNFFKPKCKHDKIETVAEISKNFGGAISLYAIALGIGWLITLFM